mmetsp:Transcript_60094/g.174003  ORF Transcript_60094/g.174003 Transcript_60094/m.174003 type:complete len:218 (+) Transcript_60094:268-921(+)
MVLDRLARHLVDEVHGRARADGHPHDPRRVLQLLRRLLRRLVAVGLAVGDHDDDGAGVRPAVQELTLGEGQRVRGPSRAHVPERIVLDVLHRGARVQVPDPLRLVGRAEDQQTNLDVGGRLRSERLHQLHGQLLGHRPTMAPQAAAAVQHDDYVQLRGAVQLRPVRRQQGGAIESVARLEHHSHLILLAGTLAAPKRRRRDALGAAPVAAAASLVAR